jgi:hypothetical protein
MMSGVPLRNVSYRERETIKNMYLRVFSSAEGSPFIRSSASQIRRHVGDVSHLG